ncbi:MAG TPA: 50S ribosomal protein L21 [Actinomycetota bacterium]|jgi:large subunit ribosomal protein L21|nr:50S ribosomal protein L21 [Actinomycetota bacterium]
MYAVIKTGGKQHKVKPGDIIEVEHLQADGESVTFQPVLVVDDDGTTHFGKEAQRATVTAKLVGEQKGDKVQVFKYKNKSGYARRQGHRQLMTLLEISDVKLGAARKSTAKKTAAKDDDAKAAEASASASESASTSEG